VKLKFVEYLKK